MHVPPLRVRIAASRLLAGALLLVHGGGIACVVLFLPGLWVPALATAAIGASLVFHVRRDALQFSGDAVIELLLKDGAGCEFMLRNGDTLAGSIEGSTFVAPLLIVINISSEGRGRRRSAILLPDSAPAEDLRRIRVWLRHRAQPNPSASGRL